MQDNFEVVVQPKLRLSGNVGGELFKRLEGRARQVPKSSSSEGLQLEM